MFKASTSIPYGYNTDPLIFNSWQRYFKLVSSFDKINQMMLQKYRRCAVRSIKLNLNKLYKPYYKE